MKAVLDVHYETDRAIAACVLFRQWEDGEPAQLLRAAAPNPLPYRAGRFFERELPCLTAVLERAGRELEVIVIDGYVHLRPEVGKGLGARLGEALPYEAVILGVAKNPLAIADRFVPVTRGRSGKPLYVSALGCPLEHAAACIMAMHGAYRIPTLLQLADRHAREG